MTPQLTGDGLEKILMQFPHENGTKDSWTIDDATKGIAILGGTGSGKTSASGRTLALKFLKEGWGGLVLCAKPDEAELWEGYCQQAGRSADLIMFQNRSRHKNGELDGQTIVFNPIDYELKREGEGSGDTQNITNIFMNIYRMGNRIASEGDISKEERFWDSALKRCISRAVELLKISGEDLSIANMVKILTSCTTKENGSPVISEESVAQAILYLNEKLDDEKYNEETHFCSLCLAKAFNRLEAIRPNISEDDYDYEYNIFKQVYTYYVNFLNSLDEKTKSTIIESFMGLAEPFLSGILNRHFSGTTNIFPEWTYQQQKIIVLNFPIKEFLDVGIIGQCVFKLLFQQAIERRKVSVYPRPVFLWADEAQMFINPYDQIFLTTARSSRTATVYLTQNISNYLAVMGSGQDSKSKVDSLLGNLCTKIFHANMDAVTNEYASQLIGNDITAMKAGGSTQTLTNINDTQTQNYSMQIIPQVLPKEFTILRSGGAKNDFKVEAYILVSGKKWANNKNFMKATFLQDSKR